MTPFLDPFFTMKPVGGWVGSYFWNHGGSSFQKDTISDRWGGDDLVRQKYIMFSAFCVFSKAELSVCFITDFVDADVLKIRALFFPFFSFFLPL